MKIKVQCVCGSKFEFEVEPVQGKMPVAIQCPRCGADATEAANQVIAAQSAAPPPAPAVKVGLRVAGAAPAADPASVTPPPVTEGATENPGLCLKHFNQPLIDSCRVCGKPICLKCMEQFGYICSAYCKEQAASQRLKIPKCPHQFSEVSAKEHTLVIKAAVIGAIVLALVSGGVIYYSWVLAVPKVVYENMRKGDSDRAPVAEFAMPEEGKLFEFTGDSLSLRDIPANKQIWTTKVEKETEETSEAELGAETGPKGGDAKTPAAAAALAAALESAEETLNWLEIRQGLIVRPKDVWLLSPRRILQFDRQTGVAKGSTHLTGHLQTLVHDDLQILAVTLSDSGTQTWTRIDLDSGKVDTESSSIVTVASKTEPPKSANAKPSRGGVAKVTPKPVSPPPKISKYPEHRVENFLAGANALCLDVKLLAEQTAYVQALKPVKKSVMNGTLNASQGLEAAHEILNDLQRQKNNGLREEDVSLYGVNLHRRFADKLTDWSGQVHGPPTLVPLKTVDVVAAGTNLFVFNRENKLLWQAKLAYPTGPVREEESGAFSQPCAESAGVVYFADRGTLTSFDAANGNVHWRLTSVGIRSVKIDDNGNLYVTSTTAPLESIDYSMEIDLEKNIQPVVMKVDPASGRVLWQIERFGDEVYPAGKYLYVSRTTLHLAVANINNAEANFHLQRVDPSSGRILWDHYEPRHSSVEARGTWIALGSPRGVKVLKYISF